MGVAVMPKPGALALRGHHINVAAIPGTVSYCLSGSESASGPAAAHVTGAVAVLAGAFPKPGPQTELVSIILETADYIPFGDQYEK